MSHIGRIAVQLEPSSRSGDFLPFLILKKIVYISLNIVYWSSWHYSGNPPMARMLGFNGNECLWNVFVEVLESEGYTVCKACNDDEGLPHPCTELIALTLRTIQYVVAW